MSNQGNNVDFQNLMSLANDLVGVLSTKNDGEALIGTIDSELTKYSEVLSSSRDVQSSIEEYEIKIESCNREIEKVQSETVPDVQLVKIENEVEQMVEKTESLHEELRAVDSNLEEYKRQLDSLEKRKINIQESEKDRLNARSLLSLSASVTGILPNLEDQENISGNILDKNKKGVKTFEVPKSDSSFEICNNIWNLASH